MLQKIEYPKVHELDLIFKVNPIINKFLSILLIFNDAALCTRYDKHVLIFIIFSRQCLLFNIHYKNSIQCTNVLKMLFAHSSLQLKNIIIRTSWKFYFACVWKMRRIYIQWHTHNWICNDVKKIFFYSVKFAFSAFWFAFLHFFREKF